MQGQLFTQDFLRHGIRETPPYQALDEEAFTAFQSRLHALFAPLSADSTLNEAQTEQLIIERVLVELGWADDFLPQVNLSGKRREDVPDILLFADAARRGAALAETRDDRRYRHGLAILEAKRWLRPLDRGDAGEPADPGAPSSQMLRYLSRAELTSDRAVKWGVLTNGGTWRLYWQDARSRAEEFLELDIAALLGVPGVAAEPEGFEPAHGLKLFFLLFNRAAFLTQTWDREGRTFHAYARNEARAYEEKVSADLGQRVFDDIFPTLAHALAKGDLQARMEKTGYGSFTRNRYTADYLAEVREATLVLLYRLLFLFYAEDRRLLPVDDPRYRDYSVRALREEVRDKVDAGAKWSGTLVRLWLALKGAFELIDLGDDTIGIPAYNGGLFNRSRSLLLERTRVPDAVLAPIIDMLGRRTEEVLRGWINYRDLSVSHLGGIYERLLEYSLVHEVQAEDDYRDKPEIDRIVARPASFARKTSGSYYTHDDLVRLILRESVGLLADERQAAFDKLVAGWKKKTSLTPADWERLDAADPASTMLELKVCDPAMGSGHFLVALVDFLADRVLEAATAAQLLVAAQPWAAHLIERGRPWESPLVARIAHIRASIRKQASEHGWRVTDAQLDDRHIVRRMVLKKSLYGVDKNAMAVELAKTALWLHTFTVGAPLSFLDHHLKHGDSLHGERLADVQRGLHALGTLFQQAEMQRLEFAAKNLAQVADFTDVDIAEVRLSRQLAEEAEAKVAPLHALMDFWRALRWLAPGWPPEKAARLAKLGDEALRQALPEVLSPERNLVALLHAGQVEGDGAAVPSVRAANDLLARVRRLAAEERFFHWWTAFPTAFAGKAPGFDAVIGNPPWDRIKLQEVEWFAEREPAIAREPRAADRKALIATLQKKGAPLAAEYTLAVQRAEANARVLAKAGDYPLLGGGDVNLYSLFVERAQALVKPDGVVALLTPSGIAADKGAATFFRSIATTKRLGALFDFENRRGLFPDVDSRFKFCTLVFGGEARTFAASRCAFFLHTLADLDTPGRTLALTAADFALMNPNTGAAPVFRSARDLAITRGIYERLPVLARRSDASESKGRSADRVTWPVVYQRVFDMTMDSKLFCTAAELRKRGFVPAGPGRWSQAGDEALPLYVGRMVHQYDHRHADVTVNEANLHVAALGEALNATRKGDPGAVVVPQYWVLASEAPQVSRSWTIGFRDIARATDVRTMIAAIVPSAVAGNTLPLLRTDPARVPHGKAACLLALLNSLVFDYVARQKAQTTHLNWYIVEQLPVVPPERFDDPLPPAFAEHLRAAGLMNGRHPHPTIADFVVPQVLALSYTAHDLAEFARDLGYVDEAGHVLPPVRWDDEDRRQRRAALDALFFHLYGLGADDAAYVLDTFPIVREQDEAAFGRYRTKDDVLALLALLPVPAPPLAEAAAA
ncbi:MAG: Eco57I restriction-modification methylase domain-containing protein [Betaproteobacteria bacterium]|nr:Eco57I restriction-modification methylase domain-containing protein [Betaproteobacteria bacterium]